MKSSLLALAFLLLASPVAAQTLHVGPGQTDPTLAAAAAARLADLERR